MELLNSKNYIDTYSLNRIRILIHKTSISDDEYEEIKELELET